VLYGREGVSDMTLMMGVVGREACGEDARIVDERRVLPPSSALPSILSR